MGLRELSRLDTVTEKGSALFADKTIAAAGRDRDSAAPPPALTPKALAAKLRAADRDCDVRGAGTR
jgi:hypothetical protein